MSKASHTQQVNVSYTGSKPWLRNIFAKELCFVHLRNYIYPPPRYIPTLLRLADLNMR